MLRLIARSNVQIRHGYRFGRSMGTVPSGPSLFDALDTFTRRHVAPDRKEEKQMLKALGYQSMKDFEKAAVPEHIRVDAVSVSDTSIPPLSESELLRRAADLASTNKVAKSYIGMGYHNAVVPPVILRNVRSLLLSRALSSDNDPQDRHNR